MPENWSQIAAEVEEAIRSVSDVSRPSGFPVTLRKEGDATGDPWNPTPGAPTYTTFYAVDDRREVRDASGTLIGETRRTLTVNATAGVVPSDDDRVAVGITAAEADDGSPWLDIIAVRPLSPAGIAVLYEIDVVA